MRALKMARVSYRPARAYAIGGMIGTWAQQGSNLPERGPGLTHGDAVCLATHLTILRGICKSGRTRAQSLAWFSASSGQLTGVTTPNQSPRYRDSQSALEIWGDESPSKPRFGSGQLGPAWSRDLALGLGSVLDRLRDSEKGPQVLPEYAIPEDTESGGSRTLIVAGPVISIMTQVATWRYLDAVLIEGIGYVGAAASVFETRLRAMEGSGVEIPPTPMELAAADRVRQWARPRYNRDLLIGGGTVAGSTIGVSLLAAVRSRAEA